MLLKVQVGIKAFQAKVPSQNNKKPIIKKKRAIKHKREIKSYKKIL